MICIGDFDLGVGIVMGIGIGIILTLLYFIKFPSRKIVQITQNRLKDILRFSYENPKLKDCFYPTNLFKANNKDEFLEVLK